MFFLVEVDLVWPAVRLGEGIPSLPADSTKVDIDYIEALYCGFITSTLKAENGKS